MRIQFDRGTLLCHGQAQPRALLRRAGARFDTQAGLFRLPAYRYARLRDLLDQETIAVDDQALRRPLERRPFAIRAAPPLRPYQEGALLAWRATGGRGVVVLPTGSGKTRVALAAMEGVDWPILCIAPTRALVRQWQRTLLAARPGPVGILGDGERSLEPLADVTVATFESARRHMARIGNRFALLIVDEVHHFGGSPRDEALEMAVAPARLGLTATPTRDPARLERLQDLVGPEVFHTRADALAGSYLAHLKTVVVRLPLTAGERRVWERERAPFTAFWRTLAAERDDADFRQLVRAAQNDAAARDALSSWRRARRLLHLTSAKLDAIDLLLRLHAGRGRQRVLVFTGDNDSAYQVARRFLIPPVTCHTGAAEREEVLRRFRSGEYRALVSARVLNEGLDVPEAEVGIVVAGSHGGREHAQRLGRLLRPGPGKIATCYELVTLGTPEHWQAERRRGALDGAFKSALHVHWNERRPALPRGE